MEATIALQILPKVESNEEVIRIVDAVILHIDRTGLRYEVGPLETTIEGDLEDLLAIIADAQRIAIEEGAQSVSSYIKMIYAPNMKVLTIDEKIKKYRSSI